MYLTYTVASRPLRTGPDADRTGAPQRAICSAPLQRDAQATGGQFGRCDRLCTADELT